MTKRHFIAIAAIFKRYQDPTGDGKRQMLAFELASFFKQENPRFDRARFLEACGVSE